MNALEEILDSLGPSVALRCLVKAWRGAASPMLVEEIRRRSEPFARTTDWDLDHFDVTTLPRVLSWLCDSGPFSADLEVVLDRIEPLLPDPRAAKPLAELAEKNTRAQARIRELAARQVLPPSSLDEKAALDHLRAVAAAEQEHQRHFEQLLIEESRESRAVLADWLMDRGEPFAEFAGLQLGRRDGPSERELALWGQHGVGWIRLFLGASLLRAGNGATVRSQVRFEGGVPVRVAATDIALADATGVGWRHVRELTVTHAYATQGEEPVLSHAVARVTKLDLPLITFERLSEHCAEVKELSLYSAVSPWGSISKRLLALPRLESVRIERRAFYPHRFDIFSARGLAKALKMLRQRSISVTIQLDGTGLSIPLQGRPFITEGEVVAAWKPVLEAVHQVTKQLVVRGKGPVHPELEAHFLPRDES